MKLQIQSHISKMQGDVFVGEAGFTRVQPTTLHYNTTELAWSSLISGYPDISRGRPDCKKIDWSVSEELERSRILASTPNEGRSGRGRFWDA
jgi:hypothetical protein